ncbi:11215_t:CDS:2 [Dentiscutata erythropus]|uniref:11215_t:CDS:1 n=1 Tax=Dentiscutata erythropus TaxID=1348616 RepID=A0A9N9F8W8_9GLOM|nr:11215_t:CDS:2 [Dentiscutata erythropus]
MFSLFENVKDKVIAAKQYLKKDTRSHLEIIFANQILLKKYTSNGKEPTITEIQEELPKENIPVSNLEENPKENAKDLANLDIIMMYTEEVIKKNDENNNKLESLHIQEEVENQLLLNKAPRDKLTIEDLA